MKILNYTGSMLAKSTIHHGSNKKTGSLAILRTIDLYYKNGEIIQMPYVNGNAIRGKLRRLIMKEFFDLAGISTEDLNIKIYHIFFTGGALESTDSTSGIIDLALRKQIRKLLIPINLFGCAIGNQMIPGKMKVSHAFPICKEYSQYLPDEFKNDERALIPVCRFTNDSYLTRKDDLKAERAEDEQAMQMMVEYECFIPGTKFYHWWALEGPTELEESCFGRLLEIFNTAPYIGGMSRIGNGEVILSYQPAFSSAQLYLEFVLENKENIKELINGISKKI